MSHTVILTRAVNVVSNRRADGAPAMGPWELWAPASCHDPSLLGRVHGSSAMGAAHTTRQDPALLKHICIRTSEGKEQTIQLHPVSSSSPELLSSLPCVHLFFFLRLFSL